MEIRLPQFRKDENRSLHKILRRTFVFLPKGPLQSSFSSLCSQCLFYAYSGYFVLLNLFWSAICNFMYVALVGSPCCIGFRDYRVIVIV